jgi:predicted ribosomally synthesized peptide with SipW-like signal peptide
MHMNKKILKGALAGTAVIALAAGGGTFASWSDFQVDSGNHVGADHLALTVGEPSSAHFDNVQLAPGEARDTSFYVASRTGVAVPDASLTMTLTNLVPTENGCDSNSEAFAESGGTISDSSDLNAPCNFANRPGQFADQAMYYVQSRVASSPAACTDDSMDTRLGNTILATAAGQVVDLLPAGETLQAGEGVCVDAEVFLPDSIAQYGHAADNKSQGDQATFDIRFDLTQVH